MRGAYGNFLKKKKLIFFVIDIRYNGMVIYRVPVEALYRFTLPFLLRFFTAPSYLWIPTRVDREKGLPYLKILNFMNGFVRRHGDLRDVVILDKTFKSDQHFSVMCSEFYFASAVRHVAAENNAWMSTKLICATLSQQRWIFCDWLGFKRSTSFVCDLRSYTKTINILATNINCETLLCSSVISYPIEKGRQDFPRCLLNRK